MPVTAALPQFGCAAALGSHCNENKGRFTLAALGSHCYEHKGRLTVAVLSELVIISHKMQKMPQDDISSMMIIMMLLLLLLLLPPLPGR